MQRTLQFKLKCLQMMCIFSAVTDFLVGVIAMPFKIELLYLSNLDIISSDEDATSANRTISADHTPSGITPKYDMHGKNETGYADSTIGPMNNTNERTDTNTNTYPAYTRWPHGDGVCMLWLFADMVACTASIWNLAAIALDRLLVRLLY